MFWMLNRVQGVFKPGNIKQPFRAEPWSVSPTESFAEGVVWSGDIPVAVNVWNFHRALRPIGLPLRNLHPHDSCKND